jgi:hypothetical protein
MLNYGSSGQGQQYVLVYRLSMHEMNGWQACHPLHAEAVIVRSFDEQVARFLAGACLTCA